MFDFPVNTLIGTLGLLAGVACGVTAQRTNFCAMGAISDMVNLQDYRRFRAWLLAIAVAIAGSQALHIGGVIDLQRSIYLTPSLGWLGAVLGGALFGFGMTLAGGCGSKTLVRLGSGNLKSLVVALVLGVFAYMTLRGLIAVARTAVIEATNLDLTRAGLRSQGLPDMLSAVTGLPASGLRLGLAAGVGPGLLVYCFKDRSFRRGPSSLSGVLALGCTIGQGVTGLSTLAANSVLAFLSILGGGVYGLKYLEEGTLGGALRAMLAKS